MFTLTLDRVKALLTLAAKSDERYYLCGIHFDPKGFAVATDGHVLAAELADRKRVYCTIEAGA